MRSRAPFGVRGPFGLNLSRGRMGGHVRMPGWSLTAYRRSTAARFMGRQPLEVEGRAWRRPWRCTGGKPDLPCTKLAENGHEKEPAVPAT